MPYDQSTDEDYQIYLLELSRMYAPLATPLSPTMAKPPLSADWTTTIASSDWLFASNLPPSLPHPQRHLIEA